MPSALVPPHPGLWAHPPFILLASEWRPPWGLLAWAPFSFIGFSVRKCSPAMTMMIWFTWASTASLVLLEFGQPCCLDWIPPPQPCLSKGSRPQEGAPTPPPAYSPVTYVSRLQEADLEQTPIHPLQWSGFLLVLTCEVSKSSAIAANIPSNLKASSPHDSSSQLLIWC